MGSVIRLLLRTANRTTIVPRQNRHLFLFDELNNKRIMVPILVRYGSRSNTKKRTVKINGSVCFTLLTVRLENGTVTVAVKNGTVNKTENRKVRTRTRIRWQIRNPYCEDLHKFYLKNHLKITVILPIIAPQRGRTVPVTVRGGTVAVQYRSRNRTVPYPLVSYRIPPHPTVS